jgi:hypothetical protein
MPKEGSDDIFLLINSLSTAEKRFFKHFAAMGNAKKEITYVRLFDAIENQKSFDEKKLLKKVKNIPSSQLPNQKKYLYNLILESLRWFHSQKNIDAELRGLIGEIEILYDKRLMTQCARLVKKAKKMALQSERHRLLSEVLLWEETLQTENAQTGKTVENENAVFEESKECLKQIESITDYKQLLTNLLHPFRHGGMLRTGNENEVLEKIMKDSGIKKEKELSGFFDHYYFYQVYGIYYMLRGEWSECYRYRKLLMDLFDSNPDQIESSPRLYFSSINSYIISCEYMKRTEELENTFGIVRKLLFSPAFTGKDNLLVRLLQCCASVLHYYIHAGEFEKGVKLFEQIETMYVKLANKLSKTAEMSFRYTLAYIYFGAGEFKRTQFWLNKILNEKSGDIREDIQVFARLLFLITQFEMGNDRLLEYYVKSTYGFLYKRKRLFRIETIVLDFIRKKLPKFNTKKEMADAFRILKTDIEKISHDPHEKRALEYFDFIKWLESKISGKSFAEVMKK